MADNNIMPPRVPFTVSSETDDRRKERLVIGTKWAGIVIDFMVEGIQINGYYSGSSKSKYSNLMKWAFIPWEDIEKARDLAGLSMAKRAAMAAISEYELDETPDKEYLDTLPQVNLNGRMYYMDGERRERRPVKNPRQVFKYDSALPKGDNHE